MIIIEETHKKLTTDLTNMLVDYLSPLNLKFILGGTEIYANEVFMNNGALALFLYDKLEFIQNFIETTAQETGVSYNIEHVFTVMQPSILNFKVDIIHDFNPIETYKPTTPIYHKFIYSLTHEILSSKNLVLNDDNVVNLDPLLEEFQIFLASLSYDTPESDSTKIENK